MGYKVLKEDDQCFHVQHEDGSVFPVAKKGLAGETLAKIKAIKAGGMQEGGEPTDEERVREIVNRPLGEGLTADTVPEPKTKDMKLVKAAMGEGYSDPAAISAKIEESPEVANAAAKEGMLERFAKSIATSDIPERVANTIGNGVKELAKRDDPIGWIARRDIKGFDNMREGARPQSVDEEQMRSRIEIESKGLTPEEIWRKSVNDPNTVANLASGQPTQMLDALIPTATDYNIDTGAQADVQNPAGAAVPVPPPAPVVPKTPVPVATPQAPAAPRPPIADAFTPFMEEAQQRRVVEERMADDATAQKLGMDPNDYQIFKSEPRLQPLIKMGLAEADRQSMAAQRELNMVKQKQQRDMEIEKQYQQKYNDLAAQRAQIRSNLMTTDTDPERWWNSKSTGQQMMSSIGMIIGGYGAGLTGGPNQAFEQINKIAERDLASQRMDLGKKENMLSQLMAEGHDLESASQTLKTANMEWAAYEIQKSGLQDKDQMAQQSKLSIAATIRQMAEQQALDNLKQRMVMEKDKASTIASMSGAGYVPTKPMAQQLAGEGWQHKPEGAMTKEQKEALVQKNISLKAKQDYRNALKSIGNANGRNANELSALRDRALLETGRERFGPVKSLKELKELSGEWFDNAKWYRSNATETAKNLEELDADINADEMSIRAMTGANTSTLPAVIQSKVK